MSWLDNALEKASNSVEIDVRDLGLGVDTIQAIPLSAAEYQVLKRDPELAGLPEDDKTEALGIRAIFEMLAKCDKSLKWGKFKKLPLQTIGDLATKVTEAVGYSGGGALGES